MTTLPRPATTADLFLWVMHRFASKFDQHAVLKGGMALKLLDSPRSTTDIDYVFVPYASKNDVLSEIEAVFEELEDATVDVALHSKMLRVRLQVDDARIQIEVNVAERCPAIPMATGNFAREQGQPSQIVSMMHFDTALAEKLAAWNERRLMRDLYDCYFLVQRLGARIDLERLDQRLSKVDSRLPTLRKKRQMTRGELARELERLTESLEPERLDEELGPLLPTEELAGLAPRLRVTVSKIVEWLE